MLVCDDLNERDDSNNTTTALHGGSRESPLLLRLTICARREEEFVSEMARADILYSDSVYGKRSKMSAPDSWQWPMNKKGGGEIRPYRGGGVLKESVMWTRTAER